MRTRTPSTVGQGYMRPRDEASGVRRICITFDPDTFEQLRQRAAHNKQSLAAVVRDLVEWSMMP